MLNFNNNNNFNFNNNIKFAKIKFDEISNKFATTKYAFDERF